MTLATVCTKHVHIHILYSAVVHTEDPKQLQINKNYQYFERHVEFYKLIMQLDQLLLISCLILLAESPIVTSMIM